ncbi:MAG: HAMP domain-containing histidine kinase [Bacteroides sp.]|nr:HAMP domain-containing histidine kinase [Bacteroides sp.]MCM1549233.1 HAMP domain-containing histidine kinase [Clostridium sp.]
MKLRTKIIAFSSIAVAFACLLSDGIIWKFYQKTKLDEALLRGYQTSYAIRSELSDNLKIMPSVQINATYINYYFKSRGDDYSVCIRIENGYNALSVRGEDTEEYNDMEELYNHTVFSVQELLGENYKSYERLLYSDLTWKGGHYLVFADALTEEDIVLFHIVDINYVWEELEQMILIMLLITAAAAAAVIFLLSMVLKAALRPLQELNTTTQWIAEGLYDQRVEVKGQDEIGQLAECFNAMAEAVEARTRNLEESEQKKTLFMGNLTHELKTPMTAISGYAQTLLSTKLSREDEEEALHYIYEECGRLERLSKKMMKLLELDQEETLELEDIPVRSLFEAAERSCQVLLREKQMTLTMTEHGERFRMDFDLMTDVIINLIDNGIKASQPGESICLLAEGNTIQVQDFGQGIPKEEQERILEPFYMIDKSRSRKNGGAGLGLALTALIMKRHQASLRIESEVGKGTRMILQFV